MDEATRERAIAMAAGSSQPQLYQRALEVLQAQKVSAGQSILDVGCGHGAFLNILSGAGFTALAGCDALDAPGTPPGVSYRTVDLNATWPYEPGAFDVVTSIEVIEHLENPRHHLRELHRVCAPGGLVLITTPNIASLISRLSFELRGYFHYFGPSDYPAHITALLPIDMERILGEAGFSQYSVGFSDWGRIPGTGGHWQATALGKALFRGRAFSDQMVVVALK